MTQPSPAPIYVTQPDLPPLAEFLPYLEQIWQNKVLTNGGPAGATELMATMSYNTAILGGRVGEGAAISTAMVPFLLAAIMVSWFGLQRRKWQQGEDND